MSEADGEVGHWAGLIEREVCGMDLPLFAILPDHNNVDFVGGVSCEANNVSVLRAASAFCGDHAPAPIFVWIIDPVKLGVFSACI